MQTATQLWNRLLHREPKEEVIPDDPHIDGATDAELDAEYERQHEERYDYPDYDY